MTTGHLVQECGEAISAALDKVGQVELMYLSPAEKAAALVDLARLESRVASVRLRLMAVADDVAEESGDRDVAAWFGRTVRADRRPARRDLTLAQSLEHRWTLLAEGSGPGDVSTAQADVIARALDDLPDKTPADIVATAERVLVEHAATFAPAELRVLGSRILDVVAPEVGEDQERKRLEDEERRARKTTSLDHAVARGRDDDHPDPGPRRHRRPVADLPARVDQPPQGRGGTSAGDGDVSSSVPYSTRLGHAFCDLLEHLDPTKLPVHGGTATTVVVTMDLDALMTGLGVATTSTGDRITAAEIRRLACTAKLVPAVLGGKSEVLDLGRAKRLYNTAQRKAMGIRDGGCRAEGCEIPAAWCEAHHLIPWSRGGKTDLADGLLLCSHHHHRAHDDRYLHDRLPSGDLRFHRRR